MNGPTARRVYSDSSPSCLAMPTLPRLASSRPLQRDRASHGPASIRSGRCGAVNWLIPVILASLVLLVVLLFSLQQRPAAPPTVASTPEPLIVYCAASNKGVLEAIRADYEKDFGIPLQISYGPSQTLLAGLEVSGLGDVYLPADDSYLDLAEEKKLIGERHPLAGMHGIVAVPKGNPRHIARFEDLFADGHKLAQASPDASAIGKLTRAALTANGKWDELHAHTTVYKTNVNEVANDVKVGAVDAGIIYDAMLHDFDTLEGVALPELKDVEAHVAVAVLKSSRHPERATHFAHYLAAKDKGLARYREFGFEPVERQPWSEPRPAAHE